MYSRHCGPESMTRITRLIFGILAGFVCASTMADTAKIGRYVQDDVLISISDPSLAIAVGSSFTYVGRHSIAIGNTGAGERFIFVDDDKDSARRLFIVQFEGFLPGIDDEFRYNLSASPTVANYRWRSNGYAFDLGDSVAANPTGEAAATRSFLDAKGYSVPNEWMMWRSLTIVDEERRKEAIIFYIEDVQSTGLTLDDFYLNDEPTPEWKAIQEGLESRANRSFQLAEIDRSGRPIERTWASLPDTFEK